MIRAALLAVHWTIYHAFSIPRTYSPPVLDLYRVLGMCCNSVIVLDCAHKYRKSVRTRGDLSITTCNNMQYCKSTSAQTFRKRYLLIWSILTDVVCYFLLFHLPLCLLKLPVLIWTRIPCTRVRKMIVHFATFESSFVIALCSGKNRNRESM